MKHSRVALIAIWFLLCHGRSPAAEPALAPSPVSPGLPDRYLALGGTCPTFSWAGLMRGEAQELVVYEVDESGEVAAPPTLTLRLPALASSWTPAGEQCFDRGKSYAWSLRAIGDAEPSEWGETRFFSVPAGPSEEEFRAGLEVVKAYLALRDDDSRGAESGGAAGDRSVAERDPAGVGDGSAPSEDKADGRIRTAKAGVVSSFRVWSGGVVEAASFVGDGSDLINIGRAAIATDGVGGSEIEANAVDGDEILDGSVTAAEIAAGAVGSIEIATGAVGASEIATDAVGAAEIVAGAVGASEMAGTFCLVKRSDISCPPGYSTHFMKFDTEDSDNSDECTDGVVEYSCAGSLIWLGFCCA